MEHATHIESVGEPALRVPNEKTPSLACEGVFLFDQGESNPRKESNNIANFYITNFKISNIVDIFLNNATL